MSDPVGGQYSLNLLQVSSTINSTKNGRISFSRIAFKDIFAMLKIRVTYITKQQVDFVISRGSYFHETSRFRSFVKINPGEHF